MVDAGFRQETKDWRPPAPFIAGTALIPLEEPLRCQRYQADAAQVAFTWEVTGQRRVYAAVFAEEPRREGSSLQTPPVWTWMTGGSRTDVGRLHWDEGFLPDARNLPDEARPVEGDPAPGEYWFVIWAWDESRSLVASSEARRFLVQDLGTKGEYEICCEHYPEETIKTLCAPELPPEAGGLCPGVDAGQTTLWPCYCAFKRQGACPARP